MYNKRTSESVLFEAFADMNVALAFENASYASRMILGMILTSVTSWPANVCGVALDSCFVLLEFLKNKTSPLQPHLEASFFWIEKLLHCETEMFWKS